MGQAMKVSDYEVSFQEGSLFTCCMVDVLNRSDEDAYEGMVIECNECGESMILRKGSDGVLKWRHNR